MVETCEYPDSISDFLTCGSEEHSGQSPAGPSSSGTAKGTGKQERSKGHRLLDWIREHPTAPLKHILSTKHWYNSPYKFWSKQNVTLNVCFNLRSMELINQSTKQLYQFYSTLEHGNLLFNSPNEDLSSYYYNVEESTKIMVDLIEYQMEHEDEVKAFLSNLYKVCEKVIPKRNSFFVCSPPNAGKNFFFDSILHYYLNFGQIGNFNKYCSFPLMECVNRRIILWNEPSAEPSAFETLKCIFGGDTCNVKVKYQDDAVLSRTPVIILSNNDIFPNDEAFRVRMFTYKWKACEWLRDHKKKIHPLAWPHLLMYYNLWDE